jgi:site-specific DNA-methyltransferase (adenine-specific)
MEINKIFNIDCLIGMKEIPDGSIDLVVTDPPYKITPKGCNGNTGGFITKKESMKGNIFKHNDCNCKDWMPEIYRILKEGSHCYIMCNHINLINYLNTSKEAGFHFIKCLIWDKQAKIMGRTYMSQYEYILFLRKGKFKPLNNNSISDIISIPNKKPKDENGKNLHDTSKPIELMKILIEQSTNPDELVLDSFMGIGTTAIACLQSHRNYLGYELDSHYHEIALERLKMA